MADEDGTIGNDMLVPDGCCWSPGPAAGQVHADVVSPSDGESRSSRGAQRAALRGNSKLVGEAGPFRYIGTRSGVRMRLDEDTPVPGDQ